MNKNNTVMSNDAMSCETCGNLSDDGLCGELKCSGYSHWVKNKESMGMEQYQSRAQETAIYPGKGENLYYPTIGLNGEAGEVAEKVKKLMRDSDGMLVAEIRNAILKELGDVLWYVTDLAVEIGSSLAEVAEENIKKLSSRKKRGTLHGSGDER